MEYCSPRTILSVESNLYPPPAITVLVKECMEKYLLVW